MADVTSKSAIKAAKSAMRQHRRKPARKRKAARERKALVEGLGNEDEFAASDRVGRARVIPGDPTIQTFYEAEDYDAAKKATAKKAPNHKAKKKTALAPRHSTEGKPPPSSEKLAPKYSKRAKPEA